jgi:hypothetical protein
MFSDQFVFGFLGINLFTIPFFGDLVAFFLSFGEDVAFWFGDT